ncbi:MULTISPECIES: hypothetical protein [Caulobacter]|jgi:hypothetical protein|uniref:Uncharacterized protein n=1 Tax=Caulobacter vibrioides OR37 TaxID=1292034 RepID=R0CWP1_CAUVI|nr:MULTISPECIES: hypothetical protein [Caulobacter]ENZ80715.1 hypothetical protein OR37_03433 [Caulobacter vibrioides OR37]MBQ1560822.1 hypothetical protein [Caulobacter sp.]
MIELPTYPPPGKAARNEQRKALASTCNASSVAFLGGAFLQPLVAGHANPWLFYGAMVSFLALQGALHYVLYRVED